VKNESENLAEALASFAVFADEIIVVDTGSSDNTKEIAARFTSKVYDFEWIDDFSAARNFAMSKASGSYHLWVDADDRFSPKNQAHIKSLKSMFNRRKAFYFVLVNHHTDIPSTSCLQLRCTPRIPEIQFEGRIHEQVFPSAVRAGLQLVTTDIVVTHLGYEDKAARSAKARRNLEVLLRERAEGRDDGALHFFLAMTHGSLGERDEAVKSMGKALKRFEKETCNHHLVPEGHLFLARADFEMGEYERCALHLAAAGDLVKADPVRCFHIGIIYQQIGRHREAIEAFDTVFGKKHVPSLFPAQPPPNDSELLLHMAYSYYCTNDRQKALELINSSAPQGREVGRSWEWLGEKAFAFKDIGFAHAAFETALHFGDIEPLSWARLGAVYKLRGFSGKAEECFGRARAAAANSFRQD
jgi:glycosyltransferase involved in cell wall biosynthesis